MRFLASLAALTLLACNSLDGQAPVSPAQPPPPVAARGVPLDGVLKEVQAGLQKAQDTLAASRLPGLESVQLTLHTEVSKDLNLGIRVLVFTIGGGPGASNAQEMTLTLVPPKPEPKAMTPAFAPAPTAADAIVSLIETAARTVDLARKGQPPLEPDKLVIDLAFGVTEGVSGKLKFDVGIVSADLGGAVKNLSEQKIRVTFKR